MGTLYIVATPIGNLQDISLRAIEILQTVDAIACEDTRRTGLLLQKVNEFVAPPASQVQNPRLVSYYEQNEKQRIPEIINALTNGLNIALVCDAGTPTISDPGFKLVRECVQKGMKVESIPGPSAVITALSVSGLPTDKFLFLGYLPKKPGHRKTELEKLKQLLSIDKKMQPTVIFYEAPHRLVQFLEELQSAFGDIDIVICRELTKVHEEIRRETISQSLNHFKKTEPKGEFVVLFSAKS